MNERPRTGAARLLVVDDSLDTLEVLRRNLVRAGHTVVTATGVSEALGVLAGQAFDVVITDLKMPGASGLDLIRHVRENCRGTEVLMITGFPSVESAVQALRAGAEDYLAKPFTSEELLAALDRVLAKLVARRNVEQGPEPFAAPPDLGLIGASPAMQAAFRAARAAASAAGAPPVLLQGEPGTGRQAFARAIHRASPRGDGPFAMLDAAASGPQDARRELFGIDGTSGGLFGFTAGGTLYLAEIAALPPDVHAGLARRLSEPGPGAPRVIASSASDLDGLVARGLFPGPLAECWGSSRLRIPRLADRAGDVPILVRHFAGAAAARLGLPVPTFGDSALAALGAYDWPGNVAELARVVTGLVEQARGGMVEIPDLPTALRSRTPRHDLPLSEIEAAYIRDVLRESGGNRTRAAEILGIDRKTLREKLRHE